MTEQDLLGSLTAARQLCNTKADRALNGMAKNVNAFGRDEEDDGWGDPMLESMGYSQNIAPSTSVPSVDGYVPTQSDANKSRLPKAILESMVSKPIEVKTQESAIERMDFSKQRRLMQEERGFTQRMEEANIPQSSQGVDYTIIKAIINECLDTKLKSLNILNENTTLKTIGLKEGKIRIVDNKGNIYSAKLEKVGNINDK